MVWPESSSSAARTSPRTRYWNPGLDIRVIGRLEGAKIHDERDRNRGLHGAVRTLGGAAYYSRAAPSVPTKENTTGARAQAPSRSCRCAKALTETHPGVRDWLSATRICMQSKLGTA